MKKISRKARKLLRAVCLTICAGAISLIFVACYGSPPAHFEEDNTQTYNVTVAEE